MSKKQKKNLLLVGILNANKENNRIRICNPVVGTHPEHCLKHYEKQ